MGEFSNIFKVHPYLKFAYKFKFTQHSYPITNSIVSQLSHIKDQIHSFKLQPSFILHLLYTLDLLVTFGYPGPLSTF